MYRHSNVALLIGGTNFTVSRPRRASGKSRRAIDVRYSIQSAYRSFNLACKHCRDGGERKSNGVTRSLAWYRQILC